MSPYVVPGSFCPADKIISCVGVYTLTQANVDEAHVSDTAKVTASALSAERSGTIVSEDPDTISWLLFPEILTGEHDDERRRVCTV